MRNGGGCDGASASEIGARSTWAARRLRRRAGPVRPGPASTRDWALERAQLWGPLAPLYACRSLSLPVLTLLPKARHQDNERTSLGKVQLTGECRHGWAWQPEEQAGGPAQRQAYHDAVSEDLPLCSTLYRSRASFMARCQLRGTPSCSRANCAANPRLREEILEGHVHAITGVDYRQATVDVIRRITKNAF